MAGLRVLVAVLVAGALVALARGPAGAEWQPPGLQPTSAVLADVLAANAKAAGPAQAGFAHRRERWTYASGARRLPVAVAVDGDDFRADVTLGAAVYAAGRRHGVRWRADANAIAHATLSDLQGDAVDRLPQSAFAWSAADCALAGETRGAAPAWVIADRPVRDKPHWFFVDRASGLIVREMTREGARTIVTTFDRFEPVAGTLRARHWHVAGGERADELDVTVEAIEPTAADLAAAIAPPQARRTFAPLAPAAGTLRLPAHFAGRRITVDVDLGGRRVPFILDTGTASITLDSGLAGRLGWQPVLEHATVPRMTVGGLALGDVSTLAIPLGGDEGILGYDFFFGHVVHVDYAHELVEVLPHEAAEAVFRDPATTVLAADVGEGLPLVPVRIGDAQSERFAVDTGSDHLVVLDPFERRHAGEIAAHWTPTRFPGRNGGSATGVIPFLEGSVQIEARRVAAFELGPVRFTDQTVALQTRNGRGDAIDPPFDGIVGTDELAFFDCWFDYDGGRLGLRLNPAR